MSSARRLTFGWVEKFILFKACTNQGQYLAETRFSTVDKTNEGDPNSVTFLTVLSHSLVT